MTAIRNHDLLYTLTCIFFPLAVAAGRLVMQYLEFTLKFTQKYQSKPEITPLTQCKLTKGPQTLSDTHDLD